MTRRRTLRRDVVSAASLAARSLAISTAAPQVIAHRLSRMALAGANPTAADRRESMQMVTEKMQAFHSGWGAIWTEALAQQASLTQALWMAPWQGPSAWVALATRSVSSTDLVRLIDAGLTPVHDTAVANAKRLSRRRAKKG